MDLGSISPSRLNCKRLQRRGIIKSNDACKTPSFHVRHFRCDTKQKGRRKNGRAGGEISLFGKSHQISIFFDIGKFSRFSTLIASCSIFEWVKNVHR